MNDRLLIVQFKEKIRRVPGGKAIKLEKEEEKKATPELKSILEQVAPILDEPAFALDGVQYPLAIVRTFIPETNTLIFKPGFKLTVDDNLMKLEY